jgi:hypothetical protein
MEITEIRLFFTRAMGILEKLSVAPAPADEDMYDF